ncbi:cysteine rich repeat-containing protein [Aquabacterium sp.]|uniref:cysteine rich repeat-containing protein n=1 Tax=Aquabacterium sp. TaxID=1872578 RepID=UPI002B569947|nr:cysteine rich repeat-containing protein [Aquabacterium sp.]HSW09037.1 cysteine rich repeat-containing protein [Aquabacterium sp.]
MKPTHAASALLLTLSTLLAGPAAMAADRAKITDACKADIKKLCPDVKPGGGRIAACMREKKDQMSSECKADLAKQAGEKKESKT